MPYVYFKMVISFVCLLPVRLLRPSFAVLYHENGKLQRAYYLIFTEVEVARGGYNGEVYTTTSHRH